MHADAAGADWIPSPNFNPRRPNAGPLDIVVLHSTCMSANTTDEVVHWFQTPESEVSSHYIVGKDGRVVQMVAEGMRAWHAGPCDWRGRTDINSCSVGIEMVHRDQDPKDDWPDAQVRAVARLLADIRTRHAVPDDHVLFHSEVAVPPGRKHDPVNFDRARLLRLAGEFAKPSPPPNVITPTD